MNRMVKKKLNLFEITFMLLGSFVILFIIAPLAGIFLRTPGHDLLENSMDSDVQQSIFLTLWTSMAATFILALFSIPLAYILARKHFPLKRLITGIINLPVVIPHSAAGIAILSVLSRDSVMGGLADSWGLRFIGTPAGIMVAMAFVSVPFLINACRDGFEAVPEKLEKAALTLGASRLRVFFTISLPLAWRSVLTGLVMMWARGLSEFGAVIVIAYHPMITPVLIYERFTAFGLKYSRPVAAVFIMVCLVVFIVLRLISERSNGKD
jgi:molybdate/tungstate transport system permease protein